MRHCPDVFVFFQVNVKSPIPLFKGVFIQFCLLNYPPPLKKKNPYADFLIDVVIVYLRKRLVILRNPTLFAFMGSARLTMTKRGFLKVVFYTKLRN